MATLVAYQPDDKTKKYFRSTDKSWRELASFVLDCCADFLPKGEAGGWFAREEHIVTGRLANRIAHRLNQLLERGVVKGHETELLIHYPPIPCHSCNSKGVNDKAEKCGVCGGDGKLNQIDFSERKVREFMAFIRNCNGFDIS